jgi:recombinational DNA repair ATPase RecF
MILVDEITIEEFRGIRKLKLNLKGDNFAICGPNGTGKSGVVDALEFALTGNISRLSGEGTKEISLKKHAPHVDYRDNPEKARVFLALRIPSLNNLRVSIDRNVKNANNPIISPSSPEILEILSQLEKHPEFVLSRRELIAYVLATPGKRSEEIQALLQLDQIGDLRATLKKISNSCNREATLLQALNTTASQKLAKGLEIPELNIEKLLEAVNIRRKTLGLPAIESLTATTNISDGITTISTSTFPNVNKAQVIADLKTFEDNLTSLTKEEFKNNCRSIGIQASLLLDNAEMLTAISKQQFLKKAIELVDDGNCPVCDTKWSAGELKMKIERKLKDFETVEKAKKDLEDRLSPIITTTQILKNSLEVFEKHVKNLTPELISTFDELRSSLSIHLQTFKDVLPLTETINSLNTIGSPTEKITDALRSVENKLSSLPEPNEHQIARDYLIMCNHLLEERREAARNSQQAKEHFELALVVHDVYVEETNKVLEKVYKDVESEFSEFYRLINGEDEANFTAKLAPSIAKLSFDVEFYGRGHFPPGAYHSEGHQDGMGLCLYLALMKRLLGDNFTFAVLDDVLMSVDVGHRREVCNLLKQKFPKTQFVLTTHDEVWLKHMGTAGLIVAVNSVRFSNWTPDLGPTEWDKRDIWSEIEASLKIEDVRSAAGLLRHYLEHICREICHNLRAPVEFKGDGRYDLGDVLSPAVTRFKKILGDGIKAAQSWNSTDIVLDIQQREASVKRCFQVCNVEQWQINPAIHYNEWATLTSADFRRVAKSFQNLIENFHCSQIGCNSLYSLTFIGYKEASSLRCACGNTNINLIKKKIVSS